MDGDADSSLVLQGRECRGVGSGLKSRVIATVNINVCRYPRRAAKLFEDYLTGGTHDRNALCAMMHYDSLKLYADGDPSPNDSNLVKSCLNYFKIYGNKKFFFPDIQHFLFALSDQTEKSLLQEMQQILQSTRKDEPGGRPVSTSRNSHAYISSLVC